jgi:hypothetical protein
MLTAMAVLLSGLPAGANLPDTGSTARGSILHKQPTQEELELWSNLIKQGCLSMSTA